MTDQRSRKPVSRQGSGSDEHTARDRAARHKSAPGKGRHRPERTRPAHAGDEQDAGLRTLYGIHAIDAALRNPKRIVEKLYLTDNAARRLAPALEGRDIPIESVRPRDLDRRLGADTVHQGAAADVAPLPDESLEDVLAATSADAGPLLALDQVTDPHNVGAVLRSAAVFGARALIMTRRHSPPPGATLAKSASGALEAIPLVFVQNLGDTLESLVKDGYAVVGLDGDGPDLLDEADLAGPTVLVLGAEGKGLRARTRETCTRLCRIAAPGPISSLNVSNAAAVALHLAAMRRREAS